MTLEQRKCLGGSSQGEGKAGQAWGQEVPGVITEGQEEAGKVQGQRMQSL